MGQIEEALAAAGSGGGSAMAAQVEAEEALGERARSRVWEMLLGMSRSQASGGAEQESE